MPTPNTIVFSAETNHGAEDIYVTRAIGEAGLRVTVAGTTAAESHAIVLAPEAARHMAEAILAALVLEV